MHKLAIGLYSGDYSQKIKAEIVETDENKGKVSEEDQFYQDGIRPQ
jgi:hypothetical protein